MAFLFQPKAADLDRSYREAHHGNYTMMRFSIAYSLGHVIFLKSNVKQGNLKMEKDRDQKLKSAKVY